MSWSRSARTAVMVRAAGGTWWRRDRPGLMSRSLPRGLRRSQAAWRVVKPSVRVIWRTLAANSKAVKPCRAGARARRQLRPGPRGSGALTHNATQNRQARRQVKITFNKPVVHPSPTAGPPSYPGTKIPGPETGHHAGQRQASAPVIDQG